MKSIFARLLLALIRPALEVDRQERNRRAATASFYVPTPVTIPFANEERIRLGLSPRRHRADDQGSGSPKSAVMPQVAEPASQDAE